MSAVRDDREGKQVRPRDVPAGHKFCRTCLETKPLSEWSANRRATDGLQTQCKDCRSKRGRRDHLRKSYGLTEEQAAALLSNQDGLCAICQDAPAVHIDHDHITGAIRGMLCFRCNAALGQFGDDPETLLRAARYLLTSAEERWPMELYVRTGLTRFDYGSAS